MLIKVWCEFLALRDEGRARAIGVSNYSLAQIDRLIKATGQAPAVNQISWSPGRYDAALLAGHRERGVAVEGYSPLKRTNLTSPVLTEIAGAHGAAPAQVVLRWHLEHGVTVLVKSGHPERIASNIEALRLSLDPDEVARIDALAR
jgi:diketogulonate reductase-like aldo/keto reductase